LGALFSAGDLGYDIRLDCRGLDKNDNDFLIGLIGKELFPLSAMVQAMRKTRQTSEFLESLGPFFIGKAIWQQVGL
jgi:chlorite dismutase